MEYISDQALETDKSIFTKQEHCDNPESHNGTYNRQKNGVLNYQKQQLFQGESEQRGQPLNLKQNLQQKLINNTNDQSTNNMSSTYDNSNHNYALSQQQQSYIHNDLDYFNHSYRNQQDNFQDFQEPPRNHTNKSNLLQTNEILNEEKNINSQEQANNQDSQKQPQNDKVYNIATYELQPEIKGMIVALKYIGVPNHKVVEEIGKLGFTVSDSNVYMVWEEWTEERNKLGKSILRDQNQVLKASKGQYKKSSKINRKFSGRQSSDEDEDIDYQDDDEEEEDDNDEEDSLNSYKIPVKNKTNRPSNDNRKNFQQNELESESYEFNENTTPLKGQKYSQLINLKEGEKYKPSHFDGDINGQKSDELDFDSDYDENYKKKLNESRKQNLKAFEKQPKKQIKMHGDHILFYNLEAGQCVFCAQNNKENEVYTTCMECEGQGENKFFICEECFDQNHSKQDQNRQNQQKQFVKNEDQEQPFIESDESDTDNNHVNLKSKKTVDNMGNNNAEDNQNKKIQGKSNHPDNQEITQKENKNNLVNNQECVQQNQKSTTPAEENKDLIQKIENPSNETNYEQNLMERILKSQLKVNVADDFVKSVIDNNHSPLANKQLIEGTSQIQQVQNNFKACTQKKILKIYKNPQSAQQ
ncbi:hypothetical protein ABPG72_012242 [Tetrahymena utriculariae]